MCFLSTRTTHTKTWRYLFRVIIIAILCVAFHLYAGPILQPRSCEIRLRLYKNNIKDRPLLATAHAESENLDCSYMRNNRIVITPCDGGGGMGWIKYKLRAHYPQKIRIKKKYNIYILLFDENFFFHMI